MENILYRLTTSSMELSLQGKENHLDYLDYEEALDSYNQMIETRTAGNGVAASISEQYLLIKNDFESNSTGQWHCCNLKNGQGHIFTMKIEPIQFFEAEHFASEDIEARYKALYGSNDTSPGFFARLFKRKKERSI